MNTMNHGETKCRFCRKVIDAEASVCPYCTRDQGDEASLMIRARPEEVFLDQKRIKAYHPWVGHYSLDVKVTSRLVEFRNAEGLVNAMPTANITSVTFGYELPRNETSTTVIAAFLIYLFLLFAAYFLIVEVARTGTVAGPIGEKVIYGWLQSTCFFGFVASVVLGRIVALFRCRGAEMIIVNGKVVFSSYNKALVRKIQSAIGAATQSRG